MRRISHLLLALAFVAVLASACGGARSEGTSASPNTTEACLASPTTGLCLRTMSDVRRFRRYVRQASANPSPTTSAPASVAWPATWNLETSRSVYISTSRDWRQSSDVALCVTQHVSRLLTWGQWAGYSPNARSALMVAAIYGCGGANPFVLPGTPVYGIGQRRDYSGGGASVTPRGQYIPYEGNGGGPTPCADGTWSHSSGSGTCSHHGGIG